MVEKNTEIWKNEEGSALSSVLIISVIILTFIGAILSGVILQARFIQRDIHQAKAQYNAEQQVFEFLSDTSKPNSSLKKDFLNGFYKITSEGRSGKAKATLQVIVGEEANQPFQLSTALLDSTRALTLTGGTNLIGDYRVADNSVQTNSFRGVPFRGKIEGSPHQDPVKLDFDITSYQQQIEATQAQLDQDKILEMFKINEFIVGNTNLFANDTLYFEESINLDFNEMLLPQYPFIVYVNGNLTLTGNSPLPEFSAFIVKDSLIIQGELSGAFIQLYGGSFVSINDEVSISAQIFTNGSVEVNNQAYLKYPSLIYSQKVTYAGGLESVISINDQSIVDGTIVYSTKPNLINQEQLKVSVDTTALVRGAIYTQGLTELFGTVHGTVITDQFFFYESPTSYFNWIKDATIDVSQRPPEYVLPIGFSTSPKYRVLDWRIIE